jgi:acetyl-CoA C-acetyltransferase
MTQAVIVSTARTPIGKAYRGAFNNTEGATLLGHAIEHAVKRAGVDGAEVEDVVMGCCHAGGRRPACNVARQVQLLTRRPAGVGCRHDDRPAVFASGLQAMSLLANALR